MRFVRRRLGPVRPATFRRWRCPGIAWRRGAAVQPDVAIVGGGVIGCAIARALALAGAGRIVVIERARPGAEASGAAAGLLVVASSRAPRGVVFELKRASAEMFPALAEELQRETGSRRRVLRGGAARPGVHGARNGTPDASGGTAPRAGLRGRAARCGRRPRDRAAHRRRRARRGRRFPATGPSTPGASSRRSTPRRRGSASSSDWRRRWTASRARPGAFWRFAPAASASRPVTW